MRGPLMILIYFTLIVLGLVLFGVWYMYSCGVHGSTFRFHWNEWENWALLSGILFCLGLPLRHMVKARSNRTRRV